MLCVAAMWLLYYAETVELHEQCWVCMVMLELELCCEIVLLLNMADMDCRVEDCGMSSAEYCCSFSRYECAWKEFCTWCT